LRPRNPAFDELSTYPFVLLEKAKRQVEARGLRPFDFGTGDPQEKTPLPIRESLIASIPERTGYPPAAGIPELRRAIADWIARRFSVSLDPDQNVLPSNGSKEAIYHLHQVVLDPHGPKRIVLIPDPAYPVYLIGTLFAGGVPIRIPLREERGFVPDLDAIPEETLQRTALLWLNYPNNPTGALATQELYQRAVALARRYRFWVASDEAYSEIYFDEAV
jgi:aspartate/methionine/tyrosine aminotransferase